MSVGKRVVAMTEKENNEVAEVVVVFEERD